MNQLVAPKRKTATRRPRTATREYDVVLRGTYEVRMVGIRSASTDGAIKHVEEQLKDYARNACQGNNTIEVDKTTTQVKPHVTQFQAEIKFPAKDEAEARAKIAAALGEEVFIDDVYKETIRSRRGY